MKKKGLTKLKYNIWFYFILFSLIITVVTWVFQILLFDIIYQKRRFDTLESTGGKLSARLNTDVKIDEATINTWLSLAVDANEAGIFTYLAYFENDKLVVNTIFSGYSSYYGDGEQDTEDKVVDSTTPPSSNLPSVDENTNHNPQASYPIEVISFAISELENGTTDFVCDRTQASGNFFYYATRVTNQTMPNGGYLIITSAQTFLQETVKVIQVQLIVVSVVVIILSLFISLYIANKISKPIIKMSSTAKSWADGNQKVAFIGDDYEEIRELADALNFAKEGIAQTGVLQRDLLANVSHDLKTPLTMIKAYAEMIRDLSGEIKEKRDRHTKVIIDEADRLTMLVNDILDLSKLQNGRTTPDYKRLNLSQLCERVLFRFSEFAKMNGYTIITDIEKDLFTVCDEKEIEQVFYNLIGNSINYTGDDKTIKVRLKRKDKAILFETIDTGKGISQDKLATIWDKYYRYSESHQRPVKGTGLGLSIVKTILESHNLRFGALSQKDVGSNFFIEFNIDNG